MPRKLPKLDLKPMRKEDDLEYKQQLLEVTDSSPRNIEYKQDRQLFGVRDKPITQHDALPNSEVPAKIISPGRTRCLPAEASPFSS
ncbi:hypothetical protein V6N13_081053 [Hibiscus sabdariffa]